MLICSVLLAALIEIIVSNDCYSFVKEYIWINKWPMQTAKIIIYSFGTCQMIVSYNLMLVSYPIGIALHHHFISHTIWELLNE